MAQQIPLAASAVIGIDTGGDVIEVLPDLAYRRLTLVNVAFYGPAGAQDRGWVLIDAGLPGSTEAIVNAAAHRFGVMSRPAAIILTHGHFDHVGALEELAERWDVPVYAHTLEHPYLNGTAAYPEPDAKVGGGMMTLAAPLYPRGPVDVSSRLRALPEEGSVPKMSGWRWLHTPGHSVGHVSLWRESDRTLLSADAVITTAQESAYAVALARTELHGPPMYFTQDWPRARESVEMLAALRPEHLLSGHGLAVAGQPMRDALDLLAARFDQVAHPKHAFYETHPARAEDGSAYATPMKPTEVADGGREG